MLLRTWLGPTLTAVLIAVVESPTPADILLAQGLLATVVGIGLAVLSVRVATADL